MYVKVFSPFDSHQLSIYEIGVYVESAKKNATANYLVATVEYETKLTTVNTLRHVHPPMALIAICYQSRGWF